MNLATVGVFSWVLLEPRPGQFDLDWLGDVLDLLHAGGISVDLATPTASPPAWLGLRWRSRARWSTGSRPTSRLRCTPSSATSCARAAAEACVTTNFMGFHHLFDYWRWAGEVDVVADDTYGDPADPNSPRRQCPAHDPMCGLAGGEPWLLMEQAASAVNWRGHNLPKTRGRMRLDSLRAIARVAARAALVFDWSSWWAPEEPAGPSDRPRVMDQVLAYDRPLWRAGVADADAHIRLGRFPVPFADLLGGSAEEYCPLPDDVLRVRSAALGDFTATVWGECLRPDDG